MKKIDPKRVKRFPTARNKDHLLNKDALSMKESEFHFTTFPPLSALRRSKSA